MFADSYVFPDQLESSPLAIAVRPAPPNAATLLFNDATAFVNLLKNGELPPEYVEGVAMVSRTSYKHTGEQYAVVGSGTFTESRDAPPDFLDALFPHLPGSVEAVARTAPGSPDWSKATDTAFNSLGGANVRATLSKSVRANVRAVLARLRRHRQGH